MDPRTEIARLGRVFDEHVLKSTYALYAPLQERAPKAGVQAHRDLAYGDDPRQRLDVFVPQARGAAPRAVVVYLHGGGYVAGARSPLPGLIYDNVPTFFARHGLVGVNATYRLAPEHKWPSGALDVGKAVAWLRGHAPRYGGDPERIFLVGQSAGATHAAGWVFDAALHGAAGPGVAGAMLLSGMYAVRHPLAPQEALPPHRIAYFGADPARHEESSAITKVRPGHPPVLVTAAEYDPAEFAMGAAELIAALVQCDRRMPWVRYMRGHNHVSPALQINSEADDLGAELLEFVSSA